MLAAKGEHRSPHDHQTTTASSLAPGITPHGNLVLFASDDTPALEPAVAKRLLDGFARGAGHGLLQLGASEVGTPLRSEEHTSELQSRENLVCRLLLEK